MRRAGGDLRRQCLVLMWQEWFGEEGQGWQIGWERGWTLPSL